MAGGVYIQDIGSVQGTSSSVTSWTYALDILAGTPNCALLFFLCHNASFNPSAITVTWDVAGANQAMTNIGGVVTNSGVRMRMYGLLNPSPGNKLITATWTTADSVGGAAVTMGGVLQTGGVAGAFINAAVSTFTTTTSPTMSITTSQPNTDMVLAQASNNAAFTGHPGGQDLWSAVMWTGGYYIDCAAVTSTGSSQGFTWALGASSTGSLIGCEVLWDGVTGSPNLSPDPLVGRIHGAAPLGLGRVMPGSAGLPVAAAVPPPVVGSTLPMMGVG